jgi:hypothetical protein
MPIVAGCYREKRLPSHHQQEIISLRVVWIPERSSEYRFVVIIPGLNQWVEPLSEANPTPDLP